MGLKIKPCCMPLQQGVSIIAGIQMILSFFGVLMGIIILVCGSQVLEHVGLRLEVINDDLNSATKDDFQYVVPRGENTFQNQPNPFETNPHLLGNILGVMFIIVGIICFLFHFLLFRGAKLRSERDCKIWLIISVILWVLGVIQLVRGIHFGDPFAEGLGLVLNLYFFWVVYEFRKEILEEGQSQMRPGFHSCA